MILVTGAAGKTGRAVIKALAARGDAMHASAHRETQIASVRALGATAASVGSRPMTTRLRSRMSARRARPPSSPWPNSRTR